MRHAIVKRITPLIVTGLLTTASLAAGVYNPLEDQTNGYYTAQVGTLCVTRESYATVLFSDMDRVRQMMRTEDLPALRKMEEARRLIWTKAGVPVVVEKRMDLTIQIRPTGETEGLWMPAHGVTCATAVSKDTRRQAR